MSNSTRELLLRSFVSSVLLLFCVVLNAIALTSSICEAQSSSNCNRACVDLDTWKTSGASGSCRYFSQSSAEILEIVGAGNNDKRRAVKNGNNFVKISLYYATNSQCNSCTAECPGKNSKASGGNKSTCKEYTANKYECYSDE